MLSHTYIIGDEKNEPERIKYLKEYFNNQSNITFFQPSYYTTITEEEMKKYVPINKSLHNRPLRLSEISLLLNYIYLFEKILHDHTEGYFLILESDVLFLGNHTVYIHDILPKIKELDIDCASIGRGCNLDPPAINLEFQGYQFVHMIKMRCTDSLIFSYSGIEKIYTYIQGFLKNGNSLNEPIDNFLETYIRMNTNFKFIWVYPSICIQGSQNGKYPTTIQPIAENISLP